jgi:LacI family transcriptional regulator
MTVSNVLNNRRTVSDTTRAEVLEAMRRLNFQPNAIARGLNRKPMNTLGILLPNAFQAPTSHPYYSLVLDGVMEAAVARHTDVIIYTGSLWTEDGDSLQRYRDGRSDGLVVVAPPPDSNLLPALLDSHSPFVCIGDYVPLPGVACVYVDDVQSEKDLVEHVIALGHRRIAMLCGAADVVRCVDSRTEGYRQALAGHGILVDERLILRGGFEESTIRPRVEAIVAMPPSVRPTAICATNDRSPLPRSPSLQKWACVFRRTCRS